MSYSQVLLVCRKLYVARTERTLYPTSMVVARVVGHLLQGRWLLFIELVELCGRHMCFGEQPPCR
jgi:hypothetical protein